MSSQPLPHSTGVTLAPVSGMPSRPRKEIKRPAKYNDYVCSSFMHLEFVPSSFEQAHGIAHWDTAINNELEALKLNRTWDVVQLPQGKKPIGCKWIFRVKHNLDGSINKHKARLVAKEFNQRLGKDYNDTFAPVAKSVSVRLIIALAALFHWPLSQLDVNNAFLHGDLEEEIYMHCPPGLPCSPGEVCLLKKSLCGLKQAPRQWYIALANFLSSTGFKSTYNDPCIFVKITDNGVTFLVVYVDDILITGDDASQISFIKGSLHNKFSIKDMGSASYFLGLEISSTATGYLISQSKYAADLLSEVDFPSNPKAHTPSLPHHTLDLEGELFDKPQLYRKMVGKLLYLGFSRHDLCYSVQQLSQFMHSPTVKHWKAVIEVLQYLQNSLQVGLFYPFGLNLSSKALVMQTGEAVPLPESP